MWSYILRRLLWAIPTALAVITLCYLMLHLTPGGPFDSERQVSAAVLANLQAKYHLDQPLWRQYLYYLNDLLHGDLGASFRYADWSVNSLVAQALPVSATVGGLSVILSLVIGVILGIAAALRQNSIIDYVVMFLGNIGNTIPSFVMGPVLILIFAIWLKHPDGNGWLPAGGWDGHAIYMILPVALLTLINVATIGRIMRAGLIETMSSNFIRTARAKGLPLRTIVFRHALKPALIPVASVLGPVAISAITAAVVTETVFSLPGLGKLIVNGASNRDYTLVLGLVVLITVIAVVFNLLVDLAYALLDPRIRY
ncbi:oligopeptide ABC transporter permease OppB [Amantichitinum ursilacus]|uniref:Oligopeptide transport system permease protein OppB n=1 Tax=Amantichitinum ursilacus TaxID=857265 RepID=A0A0N0XNM1_9NEIS|nr:oligopeptide ABC transporter permease OppB [Amantichitinum ursilacus]KPC55296.1 Oligopeptide transport system permease protein OppB [Amantichitinum ursilacus]